MLLQWKIDILMNITERDRILLENLIFLTNFTKICGFHDFP